MSFNLINCTPHDVCFMTYSQSGEERGLVTVAPSGICPRVIFFDEYANAKYISELRSGRKFESVSVKIGKGTYFKLINTQSYFAGCTLSPGLPPYREGYLVIISSMVADFLNSRYAPKIYQDRSDLVVPAQTVTEKKRVLYCKSFNYVIVGRDGKQVFFQP